jgi:outer membrane protein assembly factor BamD (BamD/ComL family)
MRNLSVAKHGVRGLRKNSSYCHSGQREESAVSREAKETADPSWLSLLEMTTSEFTALRLKAGFFALFFFTSIWGHAQARNATTLRVASIYVTPDVNSAKLGEVERGREVIVLETSREWLKVEANLTEEQTVTGWMTEKGIVQASTPNGDRIVFGEAVDSEDQASRRHGRRGAAQDAMRLYYRVYDLFPTSPIAAEALYRSADIRWQLEKVDVMSRPSAKEEQAYFREGMNEEFMKLVIKKFPGTKWADLATFQLIDNKLCGDWQGSSKCPEKESEMYEKYVTEHPQSPSVGEALYDAAYRQAALIEIYKTEDQTKKSEAAKSKAIAFGQRVTTQFPQSDWGARAQRLLYMIEQGIPTYGNAE